MAANSDARPIDDIEAGLLLAVMARWPVVVLAVSGGGDSVGLLHLYARWRAGGGGTGQTVSVVTVDHQLRPQSAAEAAQVAAIARGFGFEHTTLVWAEPVRGAGLQEAARAARIGLMADHLRSMTSGPAAIVTAHTADDQAETLLMRLARGSGIDGLAGMAEVRPVAAGSVTVLVRPLLTVAGARLRATLRAAGIGWIEDPSNGDPHYERARLRQAAVALAAAGLEPAPLSLSARRLRRARSALEAAAVAHEARAAAVVPGVETVFDRGALGAGAEEIQIRLLVRALHRCGGSHPPARLVEIEALHARLATDGRAQTLGGCIVSAEGDRIVVRREPGRGGLPVIELEPGASSVWDQRFRVGLSSRAQASCRVRAPTVAEWAQVRDRMPALAGMPASAAVTLPAFWAEGRLIAMALAGAAPGAEARHGVCRPEPSRDNGGRSDPYAPGLGRPPPGHDGTTLADACRAEALG